MKTKVSLIWLLTGLLWCAVPSHAAAAEDIRVLLSSDREARISVDSGGVWSLRLAMDTYDLATDRDGTLVFRKGYQVLSKGQFKGEKLLMADPSGEPYLLLKVARDKIKVAQGATETPWEFKFKPDKIKLVHLGVEYGKVKYYPDTGKIKAKDRAGSTVAELRGHGRLTGAPGALLISGLSADKAAFLMLFLLSNGR